MICVHKCATCFVRLAKCVESYYGVLPRYNKVHAVHGNVCYFFSSVCSMSYSTVLYGIRVYAYAHVYRCVGCGVVRVKLSVCWRVWTAVGRMGGRVLRTPSGVPRLSYQK